MMMDILEGLYAFLFLSVTAVCGEICQYFEDSLDSNVKYITCSTGCCGSSYNRYCCAATHKSAPDVGVIIAALVESLTFVAIVVSIIVSMCFCCKRTLAQSGRVLQTATTTTTAVYRRQTCDGYTQQGSGQPSYGQPGYSQPGYGQPGSRWKQEIRILLADANEQPALWSRTEVPTHKPLRRMNGP